ncbi:MAG: hypothetical protein LBG28_04400 [Tannerella sp.]|jgi:hypothetical protein|nr:hypothetical protein [Tannerella sp.]
MKTKILFFTLATCACLTSAPAQVSTVVGIDASSAYIFHGMTYNSGFVLQPYLNITGKHFGYLLWSNYNLQSDENGLGYFPASEFTEIDHFISWYIPVAFADFDLTLGLYNYPMLGWESDKELQLGGQKTLLNSLLTPFARGGVMFDGSMTRNVYVEVGAKGEKTLAPKFALNYLLKASWEYQGFLPDKPSGMKDLLLTSGLTYFPVEATGISLKANYAGQLSKKVLPDELYDAGFFVSLGIFRVF